MVRTRLALGEVELHIIDELLVTGDSGDASDTLRSNEPAESRLVSVQRKQSDNVNICNSDC